MGFIAQRYVGFRGDGRGKSIEMKLAHIRLHIVASHTSLVEYKGEICTVLAIYRQ